MRGRPGRQNLEDHAGLFRQFTSRYNVKTVRALTRRLLFTHTSARHFMPGGRRNLGQSPLVGMLSFRKVRRGRSAVGIFLVFLTAAGKNYGLLNSFAVKKDLLCNHLTAALR